MEMMGGMFGAAGSIGGAMIAADAQKYSANTNWAIALMNYYARERERTQARMEANRLEMKQNLGMQDVEGTKTQFKPGIGWVATETPEKQALRQRALSEEMKRLGPDAQRRRYQAERNELRQIQEEGKSKALFDEMRKTPDVTPDQLENLIYNASSTGLNRGFEDTAAVASRQALRTHNAQQAPEIFAELARSQGAQQGALKTAARTQAMTMAPQLNAERDKMQANLYNLFATRASAMPESTFAPVPLGGDPSQAARMGQASGEGSLKAAMMEGGRLPFIPPNYGMANAVGAIGAAGQGMMRSMQGQQQPMQFAEGGIGMGGLWDQMKDRVRGDQGLWSG